MQRIKRELAKAGIPYVSECLGGNIEGLRVGHDLYIVKHGSGKGYYYGSLEEPSDACYTLQEVLRLAKMEQKLRELFNLDWIRDFATRNIESTEWIEEDDEGTRKILVIDTLVHGAHGAHIPGMVLELFGEADDYDLEDPYNMEKNDTIYDALACLEDEVNECLNRLLPSKGTYYIGYHESDGSYCLFYEEYEEEEEE